MPRSKPRRATMSVRGAHQNNLKNLDLDLPLGDITVITGVSGSGKSSLAFDTLYAEGQRRYVETFSPYARQFLDRMDRPRVESITGIPPAIAIDQTNPVRTSRSTVGTMTELNDHLKLLFARASDLYCLRCGDPVEPDVPNAVADHIAQTVESGMRVAVAFQVAVPENFSEDEVRAHLSAQGYERTLNIEGDGLVVVQDRLRVAPHNRERLGEALETAALRGRGDYLLVLLDAERAPVEVRRFSNRRHCARCDIEYREPTQAMFSFNSPVGACPDCRGFGRVMGIDYDLVIPDAGKSLRDGAIKPFQSKTNAICQRDLIRYGKRKGIDLESPWRELDDATKQWVIDGEDDFDTNRWYGVRRFWDWMEGRSYKMHVRVLLSRYRSYATCGTCDGTRLVPEALAWRIGKTRSGDDHMPRSSVPGHQCHHAALPGLHLADLMRLSIADLRDYIGQIELGSVQSKASEQLLRDIRARLDYLVEVGVGYLALDRQSRTLSGGEVQRINLTTALGTSLVSTLFVLDEPSIGLHPRDLARVAHILHKLRDAGNSLVVVEHDPQLMLTADRIIDMGPGPGSHGGEIVFNGKPAALVKKRNSRTAAYLSGRETVSSAPPRRVTSSTNWLRVSNARAHNLKGVDLDLPIGHMSVISGVSGSGKSTLLHDVLYRGLMRLRGEPTELPGAHDAIEGHEFVTSVVLVDQSPIGKSARSNPASYVGAFDVIRKRFASQPMSRERGYTAGSFSFNTGLRCPSCGGTGFEHVEMQFLADVYIRCPACKGHRFRDELLEVKDLGADGVNRSLAEVLALTAADACGHFADDAKARAALQPLLDVGLDYVSLGQPVPSLSAGEAQRLKLAAHLGAAGKKSQNAALFLLDEPTTGLHFEDIAKLLSSLRALQDAGHTLVLIEHNLDVIRAADYLVELGPEGGDGGGEMLVAGTQADLQACPNSPTGRALSGAFETPLGADNVEEPRPGYTRHDAVKIYRARQHNLRDLSLRIPHAKLSVVTGVSGSGKSTLAFDILFAEGQRRYLESLNAYARQFVQPPPVPDVDLIDGIPPTVAIEQRTSRGGQKSTVGTATEIHHFLRLLFVRVGAQFCPDCDTRIQAQSTSAISTQILNKHRGKRITLYAPLVVARKGYYTELAKWASARGFSTLRVDGEDVPTGDWPRLDRFKEHDIDLPIESLEVDARDQAALDRAIEQATGFGKGAVRVRVGRHETLFSTERACPSCQRSFAELDPRLFSYNSRHGWCNDCFGTGLELIETREDDADEGNDWRHVKHAGPCQTCNGARLNPTALAVRIKNLNLADLSSLSIDRARQRVGKLRLSGRDATVAEDILKEIDHRLALLSRLGLGYLTLDRAAPTLSGGEAQRIRLAAQLGSNLRGVCYVLDEPTIGLHPRDNAILLDTLGELRDRGNTVVVVEHDEDTMRSADHLIDIGPGAGKRGGQLVASGSIEQLTKAPDSLTGRCLANPLHHPMQREHDSASPLLGSKLRIETIACNNLKIPSLDIPLGVLVGVCGVSGSGKSTLVREVLGDNIEARCARKGKRGQRVKWQGCEAINSWELIDRVLEVDQTPIGKTPRSCPATYVGVWDSIRKLFAATSEANLRGYAASRFSFNTGEGRCPYCEGQGMTRVEMNFLPDVKLLCESCRGGRFDRETLSVLWRGKSIGDVLGMSVDEAVDLFNAQASIHYPLKLMQDVGLGYLALGQHSPTLSGGEAQRLKLVTELARSRPGAIRAGRVAKTPHSLYLLDEPTVGLHIADVAKLIRVLHRLVAQGNSVVVIEHNLDLLAECNHLIELGPQGGESGGKIVASGTPTAVSRRKRSATAPFLKHVLER